MMNTTQYPPHLVARLVHLALEEALAVQGPILQL
jgi:hypothetical protein